MEKTMTLSKQEWKELAERIEAMGNIFQDILIKQNHEGLGKQDADECEADIICALSAINYVAEFASDKCVFVCADQ